VLDDGENRSAVVSIVASGGTGKTAFLRSWCSRDPEGRVLVEVDGPRSRLTGRPTDDWRRRLDSVEKGDRPATIVIDGIERISAAGDRELLQERIAAGRTIVLSGRTQPVAFDSLASERPVVTVGASDLAFVQREVDEFLRARGVLLPPEDVFALLDRTAGRAASLAVAAAALRRCDDPRAMIRRLARTPLGVDAYFAHALLDTLSAADADLLLSLATVETFTAGLGAAVSGRPDAGAAVERLHAAGPIVHRFAGDDGDEYRFDESLRRALIAELANRDSRRVTAARRAAADWYLTRGEFRRGLVHAVASRSTDLVEDILRRHGLHLVFSGETAPVRDAIASLEDLGVMSATTGLLAALATSPNRLASIRIDHFLAVADDAPSRSTEDELVLAGILAMRLGSAADGALDRLDRAVQNARRRPSGDGGPQSVLDARIFAEIARASVLVRSGRAGEALTIAETAATSAEETSLHWLHLLGLEVAATAAAALRSWPMARMLENRITRLAEAERHPENAVATRALLHAAAAAYQSCEPFRSSHIADIARARWRGLEGGGLAGPETLHLLFRLDEEEDTRAVFEQMEHVFSVALRRDPHSLAAGAFRFFDLTMHYRGRAAVRELLRMVDDALGADSVEIALGASIAREGTGMQDADDAHLESLLRSDARAWHGSSVVFGWLLLAAHASERAREDDVQARLWEALSAASRISARRPFVARHGEFDRLVADRLGGFGDLEGFARSVVDAAGRLQARSGPSERTPVLTAKERELLRELPLHQSIGQIAAKRGVSANTVKTHLRSIYGKLDARDRANAVENARSLGLL
jgi:LuxR family maltose regulon positive regulatory protein